ncbi:hypothetical protein V2J09_023095 [Rumex salicifolius]
MEVSLVATSQVKSMGRSFSFVKDRQLGYSNSKSFTFGRTKSLVLNCGDSMEGCSFKASRIPPISAINKSAKSFSSKKTKPIDSGRLYVALPLNVISESNSVNHTKAISAGLNALKLMGIDGVELPIWWGVVEKEAGDYDWSAYLQLIESIHNMGLKIHVSFHFNACEEANIPLPEFVTRIGESNPDIFFTDRAGMQYKDCLSLSVDDLPVLDGRTPLLAYEDVCESFKFKFAQYLDSTITGITMGLGPNGDLCYPSQQGAITGNGVGEFQCYDKYMLRSLNRHAESSGHAMWGLSGPHDAPKYDQDTTLRNFFKEQGGSWETQYGDFFLSWYSNELVSHGDRLLSMASSVFSDTAVAVSGKIPVNPNTSNTRAHACELTSGFYNTVNRDGYEAVARMFAGNSANLILPGLDLSNDSNSSPETLIAQIKEACKNNGVDITGENSASAAGGIKQIKKNLTEENGVVDQFIYQRMGADFFSPKQFPVFTELVRALSQPEVHSDDLPAAEESSMNLYAQAA